MNTVHPADGRRRTHRAGFSLIEVVLALLVFAMGVLGVLALFPSGTTQNRDAQDFTYSAQFARRVFDGVLAQTMGNTNFWDQLSNHVANGCVTQMVVSRAPDTADFFWQSPASFQIVCCTSIQTVAFQSFGTTNALDHILRYKLIGGLHDMPRSPRSYDSWYPQVTNVGPITLPDGTVTNYDIPTNAPVSFWWMRPIDYTSYERRYREKTIRLVLYVWPGRYGSRNMRSYTCYIPRLW